MGLHRHFARRNQASQGAWPEATRNPAQNPEVLYNSHTRVFISAQGSKLLIRIVIFNVGFEVDKELNE